MPDPNLLWKCDNDYDTEVKYKKGTTVRSGANQGVCAGQSALWCYNMLSGVRDILSKPELTRAMILQRLYDWSSDQGQLCQQVGLTVASNKHYGSYSDACLHMETNPGTYYLSMYGHGVAAHVTSSAFYAFDPNFGCYRYNSQGNLLKRFRKGRSAVGISKTKGMKVIKVTM